LTQRSDSKRPANKRLTFFEALPAIWALVSSQRWTILFGVVLVFISQAARLVPALSTKYLMDTIVLKHQPEKLPWLILVVLASILIFTFTYFAVSQMMAGMAEKLIRDLRTRMQAHMTHLSLDYFDNNMTGTLVSRIMSDVEGFGELVGPDMLDFFASLLTGGVTVVLLMRMSWSLTVCELGVAALIFMALTWSFNHSRPLERASRQAEGEVSGRLTESFSGIRVVKGYRAEKRESTVFARGVENMFQIAMRRRTGYSFFGVEGVLGLSLSSLVVMYFGGRLLIADRWTTGDFVQYTALLAHLMSPIVNLTSLTTHFSQAVAGLDRIREVMAEKVEEDDHARTVEIPAITGEVRVEDVTFSYVPGRPVLHGVSFVAQPGTVTAFVGPSGSGKSTIISLLCAFHKPDSGRILIDGTDLSTATLDSYRTQLGLVLQETFLFDGTIRENVLFSRPDATEEELLNACRMARVDEFTERFPDGYDAIVGERGVKLSGGQRQRLSIARAILADPRILILDEATSSLDSESEALIQAGLSYLMEGRTTFVIAHRLSTIRSADQIMVLEEGRILECGSHDSLYERGGRYYDLYTRQYGLEKNLFLAPFEGSTA
jgi:subfamily B ATP-binding cassette protein MsbA